MKRAFIGLIVMICSMNLFSSNIYVKAGAGGDGSKEAPYGELWNALSKAQRGDVIHTAAGTYNGKGGSGAFIVTVPHLTMVGGYNADFSQRDPFKYFTILERASDFKGDWTGLPEGIIDGPNKSDHSNLIVDGFVLDSRTRNAYKADGDINARKSWKGTLFHGYSADIKIRNSILINPYADGIYFMWQGKANEVSNCFILNTFYTGISTRSAQKDSVITIKNNVIGFVWTQPGKGGGTSMLVGNQGQTVMENNIFMFNQAFAVNNSFGNEDTIMKNNIFFQCQGGYYKLMDGDGQNLLMWKSEDLGKVDKDPESYMLLEAGGNSDRDPGLKPDKDYYDKFSNFVAGEPGKLKMDTLNQWRRSVGLPLQAGPGTGNKNWGMAYPLQSVVPNLVSPIPGMGVNTKGPFQSYLSDAAAPVSKDYKETPFDQFQKGTSVVKGLNGAAVMFKAGLGDKKMTWLLKQAPQSDYESVMLLMPGEKVYTRKFVYGYLLKGSDAHKQWAKYLKKRDKYNSEGGILIKGSAWYVGNDSYSYPVGVVIDEISRR